MKIYTRVFLSIILFFVCSLSYALEESQAQDIRFNKARVLIHKGQKKAAFQLLNENLKGKFHLDTVHFLVEYYYERKFYLKSYRYLRVLANHALPKDLQIRIKKGNIKLEDRESFIKKVATYNELSPNDLSILQFVANKLYDFHLKKTISPEYLPYLLSLAEKYLLICYAHKYQIVDTHYSLAKIAISRNDIPKAIHSILEAYEYLRETNSVDHKVSSTELQIVLAEILIKDGLAETGALIMKSASLDRNITPELREYIQTYSETIKKAFFNVIYDYQLKFKNNILQVSDFEQERGLENQSALAHHNHFNIYYQNQINRKYSLVAGLDIINESNLSENTEEANFTSLSADFKLKKYKSGNALSSFNLKLDFLSGRDLLSLTEIQKRSQQVFQYERFWLTPNGKWQFHLPLALKQFKNRNAVAIASGLSFESFESSRWWRLKYQGDLGIQQEGESLGTTFYLDTHILNQSKVSKKIDLVSLLSFYKQFNSHEPLNYHQFSAGFYFNQELDFWKSILLSYGVELTNRSISNRSSYQMMDFNVGFKYNF